VSTANAAIHRVHRQRAALLALASRRRRRRQRKPIKFRAFTARRHTNGLFQLDHEVFFAIRLTMASAGAGQLVHGAVSSGRAGSGCMGSFVLATSARARSVCRWPCRRVGPQIQLGRTGADVGRRAPELSPSSPRGGRRGTNARKTGRPGRWATGRRRSLTQGSAANARVALWTRRCQERRRRARRTVYPRSRGLDVSDTGAMIANPSCVPSRRPAGPGAVSPALRTQASRGFRSVLVVRRGLVHRRATFRIICGRSITL
jgi:hypothetical protein